MNKILFLGHFPPPHNGVSTVTCIVYDILRADNVHLVSLSINTSVALKQIEKISFRKIFFVLRTCCMLLRQLTCQRFLCAYMTLTPTGVGFYKDISFVLLLKFFRVRILYHLHGKGIKMKAFWLDKILYRFAFNKEKIILLADSLYDDISGYVKREDVYILPNGIDDQAADCVRLGGRRCVRLLFLSNMIRSKGVFCVLEAMHILKGKKIDAVCDFVGAWCDITVGQFDAKVRELDIGDRVTYCGFKSGQAKEDMFRNADIFVYPTCNDTFPLVLLEAMQWGLPIVTTPEGAIPDIIDDEKTGFLVEKHNARQLAEKIELLGNDFNLRLRIGCAARAKFLREYTFDKFEDGLMKIFDTVAKS